MKKKLLFSLLLGSAFIWTNKLCAAAEAAPAIAAGINAIAAGIKATSSAVGSASKPIESFSDKLERTMRKAITIQALKRMPDEALARIVQQRIAEERQIAIGGPANPAPIGTPQFERVKGDRFSLGGSQDPLARIGGFSGFQGAQDTVIRQAVEQTLQLKMIVKNTGTTARNTED